jgi:hypothetical protein
LKYIRNRYGHLLFTQRKFDEAISTFIELETDPKEIVALYPPAISASLNKNNGVPHSKEGNISNDDMVDSEDENAAKNKQDDDTDDGHSKIVSDSNMSAGKGCKLGTQQFKKFFVFSVKRTFTMFTMFIMFGWQRAKIWRKQLSSLYVS